MTVMTVTAAVHTTTDNDRDTSDSSDGSGSSRSCPVSPTPSQLPLITDVVVVVVVVVVFVTFLSTKSTSPSAGIFPPAIRAIRTDNSLRSICLVDVGIDMIVFVVVDDHGGSDYPRIIVIHNSHK